MRCRAILLLAFALAGSARLAMAMNDPPYYLFPYMPDATDKPPLYYTKVCPVGKTEEKDAGRVENGIWLGAALCPRSAGEVACGFRVDERLSRGRVRYREASRLHDDDLKERGIIVCQISTVRPLGGIPREECRDRCRPTSTGKRPTAILSVACRVLRRRTNTARLPIAMAAVGSSVRVRFGERTA